MAVCVLNVTEQVNIMTKKIVKPQKNYTVYKLIDSRNNTPFYVGVTSQSLAQRKSEHIYGARKNRGKNKVKESLILEILESKNGVIIEAIETGIKTIEDADLAESLYIMEYKEKYPALTNVSAGSDFYRRYSERCDIHSQNFLQGEVENFTPKNFIKVFYAGELLGKVETTIQHALTAINLLESEIIKNKSFNGFRVSIVRMFLTNKNGELEPHMVTGLNFEYCRI